MFNLVYQFKQWVRYKNTFQNINIENFSNHILDIIEKSRSPIGFYEHIKSKKIVYVSCMLQKILEIDKNASCPVAISEKRWKIINDKFSQDQDTKDENLFIFKDNDDSNMKWLKIVSEKRTNRESGVVIDVTKEKHLAYKLKNQLDIDALTHIFNANAFRRKIKEILDQPQIAKNCALAFIDVDKFKSINDTYGHTFGDRYLIAVAKMLSEFESDHSLVARISGDEFGLFFYGFDDMDKGRNIIINNINMYCNKKITLPNDTEKTLDVSIGIAWYPKHSTVQEKLFEFADLAMYNAKINNLLYDEY